jgi:tetratricopeptide (TPR) repeat protein
MKKQTLAAILILPISLMAQSNKVQTAWRNLTDYESSKDASLLVKAKDAIDLATVHEDSKNNAKTWTYRAKIYNYIFDNNLEIEKTKNVAIKDANEKTLTSYSTVSTNEVLEAINAVEKVKELDKDKNYLPTVSFIQLNAPIHFENKGIGLYTAKNYADAVTAFENAIIANKYLGKTDTSNLYKVAISSDKAGQTEKTIASYEKLASMKYKTNECYSQMVRIYLSKNDKASALNVIKKGRAAFPDDLYLMNKETEFFIEEGKADEAIANLESAIKKDPSNGALYSVLGNTYDLKANPKDAAGKELPKPSNFDELIGKAETNYKTAVEKLDATKSKETLGVTHFNLGVLYYNLGNKWYEKSSKVAAEIKANEAKSMEYYNKALPSFEKALEFMPLDKRTMFEVKRLYLKTGQPEKAKAIDAQMKK